MHSVAPPVLRQPGRAATGLCLRAAWQIYGPDGACEQGGSSRELFDAWCGDPRNGLVLCDFAVQGTLAREVLGEPSHVLSRSGAKAGPMACQPPAALCGSGATC